MIKQMAVIKDILKWNHDFIQITATFISFWFVIGNHDFFSMGNWMATKLHNACISTGDSSTNPDRKY